MACRSCEPPEMLELLSNLMPTAVRHIAGIPGANGLSSAATGEQVLRDRNLQGQVVIVTGAAGSLGRELTKVLCARGAHVIAVCRAQAQAESLSRDLDPTHNAHSHEAPRTTTSEGAFETPTTSSAASLPAGKVTPMQCDMSSLASVRAFAKSFLQTGLPLHALVNNAAVMSCGFMRSIDGHELQFSVNHLAHHLLSNLLLDVLVATARAAGEGADGRIVNVTCSLHYFTYRDYGMIKSCGIRLDRLDSEVGYTRWSALGQSKLANILHALELGKRCKEQSLPITVVAANPGLFGTTAVQKAGGWVAGAARFLASHWTGQPFLKTVQQAASTPLYCATSPDVRGFTGYYMSDCQPSTPSQLACDHGLASRLWEQSELMIAEQLKQSQA
mmetsp:Transcript_1801/g.3752  ORF Transcript_1801/g.3752 Transcript_1801/m.3752 type:complete len:388 (-) Transcript_1801:1275-2438(-)